MLQAVVQSDYMSRVVYAKSVGAEWVKLCLKTSSRNLF